MRSPIVIAVGLRRSKIDGLLPNKTINLIYDRLSYFVPGYKFMPLFKRGIWNGRKEFFRVETQSFPTGLLPNVLGCLKEHNVVYKIKDLRIWPKISLPKTIRLNQIQLTLPQIQAIKTGLLSKQGTFQLPTGYGKTEIICGLAKYLSPYQTLIVVHSKSLLSQTVKRLQDRLGSEYPIGVIGQGKFDPKNITVGMIQTMTRMKSSKAFQLWANQLTVLMIDELHHHQAPLWGKVSQMIKAPLRYGFSATANTVPEILMHLQSLTGPIIYEATYQEAEAQGRIIQPKIYIQENSPVVLLPEYERSLYTKLCQKDKKQRTFNGSSVSVRYAQDYLHHIVLDPNRNKAIADLAIRWAKKDYPVVIFVRLIAHGKLLFKKLQNKLIDQIAFLSGKNDTFLLERAKKEFKNGRIKILIVTSIFDEGIDLPNLQVLILAGGGKSQIQGVQRIGRGCRTYKDKAEFYVYDFMDLEHDIFQKHSKARIKEYKRQGWNVEEIE